MTAVLNGYGLRPIYADDHFSQARRYENGVSSGYATSLYQYSPVALNASGQIVAASVGADFIGVFMGITYFDTSGIPHTLNQFIGGTALNSNFPIWVWVLDNPVQVYQIQCDGSVAQSSGAQVNFTTANINSGNAITGLASCTANASSLTTSGQGQLRIIGLVTPLGLSNNGFNNWGDAYTEVQVRIARHQFIANKTAV